MTTHTIVVICAPLLFLVAFSMGRSSIQRKRMPGLYLRPTGSTPPSQRASGYASRATARPPRTSTGCKPDGPQRAVVDGQELRVGPSRTIALTDSSSATETRRGDPTTDATGPDRYVWPDGITRYYG